MQDQLNKIVKLIDNDDILVSYIPGSTTKAVIIFSAVSIKQEMFVGQTFGNHTYIFIVDKLDSWGNNIDMEMIHSSIYHLIEGKTVISIGSSMGGNMAMTFSDLFNVKHCLAFVPQYSVKPSIMPSESHYGSKIRIWKYDAVIFNPNTTYTIMSSNHVIEKPHLALFNKMFASNTQYLIFDTKHGFNHNVPMQLKDIGILNRIFFDFIEYGQISNGMYKELQQYLVE